MGKNTSISLGDHFESFIEMAIQEGRYDNASEMVRAGLRLLEEEETKLARLKAAVQSGFDSGIARTFDPKQHLLAVKKKRKNA
jgi:antitoxin ParD1/3/4